MRWLAISLAFCNLIAITHAAHAVDGVIEINQAKALAGGVTPSDTAGFPVTIDAKGSYRLTGDLTVPDAATTAIYVSAGDVTIDLNGFSIQGVTVCSGDPLSCEPTGFGLGIDAFSSSTGNVTVMNGTVRGMGSAGIRLSDQGRVLNVRAIGNGSYGVSIMGGGGTAKDNTVHQNGVYGITISGNGTVTGNTANYNGGHGIDAGAVNGCTVTGNTVSNNGGDGIRANGTVTGNTATSNGGYGLNIGSGGYAGNVMRQNTSGSVDGFGVEIGTNFCGTNTTCP